MTKWSKTTFITCIKENCNPRITTLVMDLVKFTEDRADQISFN